MPMMKSLFVMMALSLGTRALAQDTCEPEDRTLTASAVVYTDLDGSGVLDEISLWDNLDEVRIDVALDVPEKRGDEYSSDKLGLERGDGDGDLSLVVDGKTVGLVEVDWAEFGKNGCGKDDYESDVQVVYRQFGTDDYMGPRVFQMGTMFCKYTCVDAIGAEGGGAECVEWKWQCHFRG